MKQRKVEMDRIVGGASFDNAKSSKGKLAAMPRVAA